MNERIRVLHRAEVINAISDIFYNAEHRIDVCGNSRVPSLIFSFESLRTAIMNIKNRKDARQRYIFEITQQNIRYCKDLMKIAEVRHMNEIEANFLDPSNEIKPCSNERIPDIPKIIVAMINDQKNCSLR